MDEVKVVEKTTRWTDAERDGGSGNVDGVSEIETRIPDPQAEQPPLPPWLPLFHPGSTFTHNGWQCAVRHVGFEGGVWMMLVEPIDFEGGVRAASRSEYRRLRAQVGKKEAKRLLTERGQEVPVSAEEDNAGPND